jgi:hypothetical protein
VSAGVVVLRCRQRRTRAGTSCFAAGKLAVRDRSGRSRRPELTRSSATRYVSFIVWPNGRRLTKTRGDRAGHLGRGADTPADATAIEARLYADLDAAADDELSAIISANAGVDKDLDEARGLATPLLRQLITIKLQEGNVINQDYKFVDGTSFAAPIVASIVACMLEANPKLTPQQVKRILIDTAERVDGVAVERQGWGVVVPRKAIELALRSQI